MLRELLDKAELASAFIEPAELHGMVCGLAVSNPNSFALPELIDLAGTDALTEQNLVEDFVSAALDHLHAQDIEFAPLLPDDDEGLSVRVGGLAVWCAAFLSGFGAGIGNVGAEVGSLPQDVQEILKDFVNISGLDEDVAASEQDEAAYMELFEYVRVATILALTMMAQVSDNEPSDDGVVH